MRSELRERLPRDALPVDKRAVAAAAILQQVGSAFHDDARVGAGNAAVAQDQLVIRLAADSETAGDRWPRATGGRWDR